MRRFLLALVLVAPASAEEEAAPAGVRVMPEEQLTVVDETSSALSLPQYVAQLRAILAAVEERRQEDARAAARGLREARVGVGDDGFTADPTVLEAVERAREPEALLGAAARLRQLLAALPESEAGVAPAEVDKAALEGLQAKDDTAKGGAVGRLEVQTPSGLGRVADAMVAAYDWVAERVNRLLEWLKKLWPKSARRASPSGGASVGAIAVVVAAALLLGILTWRTVRRGAAAPVEVESVGAAPARDDDPLSRETTQWEARARELAAAGRWREAVRAFYHAVLVALFEAGLLHYQRGRTNWEYAAALSPQLSLRPAFLDLTRIFDREWYGRRQSDAEAVRACAEAARSILRAAREGA